MSVNGTTVVRLAGDLDVAAQRELIDHFAREVPAGDPVEIDLANVSFIDSAGLNALLKLIKTLREGGTSVRVISAAPQALKLFDVSGLRESLMGDGGDLPGW